MNSVEPVFKNNHISDGIFSLKKQAVAYDDCSSNHVQTIKILSCKISLNLLVITLQVPISYFDGPFSAVFYHVFYLSFCHLADFFKLFNYIECYDVRVLQITARLH